jgi:nicotinamidase/pyrazinamidase
LEVRRNVSTIFWETVMPTPTQQRIELRPGDALLLVDVQNDFLPGGRLPVPHGDEVIRPLNAYIRLFAAAGLPIFASRDWHPPEHCSFRRHGGRWPVHCVAGSEGAQFPGALKLPTTVKIISKATGADRDAYSALGNTNMTSELKNMGVRRLFVGGLATEYCVRATVEDALREGFEAVLLSDAIRSINVEPGDGDRAVESMLRKGAITSQWQELHA